MSNIFSFSDRFIQSRSNSATLKVIYAEFIQSRLAESLWSATSSAGSRIPWRLAAEAAKHTSLTKAFQLPGLYLFGSSAGAPLYLGKTEKQTLWSRLRTRYVRGKESQCQLAADYQFDLIKRGLEGFPNDVRVRRSLYGTARLKGAVAFAKHGIDGIWFTLLPVSDSSAVSDLETNGNTLAD